MASDAAARWLVNSGKKGNNNNEGRKKNKMKTSSQPVSSKRGRLLTAGLSFVGLMACLAIGVSTAQAQTYNVKSMGILEGMKVCEPTAMNAVGQVVGTATAGEHHAAFMYYYNGKEDEMEDIGGLGSRAFGINPAGIAVGDFYLPKQTILISHAALFNGENVVDLGVLDGMNFSRANGMNATRQVVGYSGLKRDADESRAFIWTSRTGMMDLGTLGGLYAQATAINDAGFVTGTSQVNGTVKNEGSHAFIYQPLTDKEGYSQPMRDLGTLGGKFSHGTAINASNHVVGYATLYSLSDVVHAFFTDGGKVMTDLGTLEKDGFNHSAALAMNNADQIVGVSWGPVPDTEQISQAAFIYSFRKGSKGPEMMNLNRLISTKEYWLLSAVAINDAGQIAATAYDYANKTVIAVLLTPAK
jgi:probable HAF family extracellular repeat protein